MFFIERSSLKPGSVVERAAAAHRTLVLPRGGLPHGCVDRTDQHVAPERLAQVCRSAVCKALFADAGLVVGRYEDERDGGLDADQVLLDVPTIQA
jgi:hypothetical protein